MNKVTVQWIVSGKPQNAEIIINSVKAGIVKQPINL